MADSQQHQLNWGHWMPEEYAPGPSFIPNAERNPGGDVALLCEADEQEMQAYFAPRLFIVESELPSEPESETLLRLIRRHRLLAVYYGRPQFFVPAGWAGAKEDLVVCGLPFWADVEPSLPYGDRSQPADRIDPQEPALRAFVYRAMGIPAREDELMLDATSTTDRSIQFHRRGWQLHADGQPVLDANASLIKRALGALTSSKIDFEPSLVQQVFELAWPDFLESGKWVGTGCFPWRYISAFPPTLRAIQQACDVADPPEHATSDVTSNASGWLPAVELREEDLRPIVFGHPMEKTLTPKQYELFVVLLEAGPDGATKSAIENVVPSARDILGKLRKSHPLWEQAILMPGKAWTSKHYRIASAW